MLYDSVVYLMHSSQNALKHGMHFFIDIINLNQSSGKSRNAQLKSYVLNVSKR